MARTDPRLAIATALRILPPGTRGKARLGRALLRSVHGLQDVLCGIDLAIQFLVPDVHSPIALELLISGVYEPVELRLILSLLGRGSVFVDVGANIGCYALPAADAVGASGRVLAFEASPTVRRYLERTVVINQARNVEIVPLAAGDYVGSVDFHEAPDYLFGMGSTAPQFGATPIQLPISKIDDILEERRIAVVDAVKVDVEGYELAVFRGVRKVLTGEHPPAILFEFLDWAEARLD